MKVVWPVHLKRASFWGSLTGALILAAACGTQTPVQDSVSSTGGGAQTPLATLPVSGLEKTANVPAPSAQAEQPATEPAAATVEAQVGYSVGDRVPEFQLALSDGSTFTSEDIISENRPVFLFFTASW